MAKTFHVRFSIPLPGQRTGARTALYRQYLQDFATTEQAIAHLAAPWRHTIATHADAIEFDNRAVTDGGGVRILARRDRGDKLEVL